MVRQIGEAWNKAFATVYEPHFGSTGGTVQNVTQLLRAGVVVGVKVESTLGLKNTVHYIISNPAAGETYTDAAAGLSFTGRFGIAADNGDGTTTLYLGNGSSISYRGNSVATVSGAASQAEVLFTPGQPFVITSNTPVTVVSAPPPAGSSWVPTTGGSFNWTDTANWNPTTVPNTVGGIAYKNLNLTGDQTVNVNTTVTLGEMVVGDSSGSENTLLQKNPSGSFVFDQAENGVAYLTRTADGTGTVTFASDLHISLNDNLTIRLAGGSANSTMVIAGTISGAGKSLNKEGGSLTLSLANANSYSGGTRILGGILSLDQSLALQNSALDTVNSVTGDAINGLRTTVTSLTLGGLTGTKALASVFTSSSGGYSELSGMTLNPGTGTTFDFSGVIANNTAGMALTKTGPGTQILSGVHTYAGATTVSSGTLEIGGAGRLGSGSYTGSLAIGSGSVFHYNSSAAQTLGGAISGSGSLVKSNSSALTFGGPNPSFTGSVTLNAGTLTLANTNALSAASALALTGNSTLKTSVQNATVNAPITLSGSPTIHAPDFGTGSTVSTLTLASAITGSGNLTFSSLSTVASNSQQTIRLNAQSAYTGTTTLNPADNDTNLIVKPFIADALPTITVLSIHGVAAGGSGRSTKFDLNGFNQTIGGLQNTAASQRAQQVLNSSSTAATLTINNPADHTFSGNLNGTNLSLTKTGPGTQTLAGANTMGGNTTINQGKLLGQVAGSSANSPVVINSPAATFGVSITDNTQTWTCASLSFSAAGGLEFDFSSILPGSVSPLTVTGLAGFPTLPEVRVITSSGLAPGIYPLMTWGSTSGSIPTLVSVLNPGGTGGLADGTAASLVVSGTTLNLSIIGVPVSTKANNTNNLNLGTSWLGGVAPNSSTTARWNNTVSSANTTVLGADATWAGITIENPGGAVTLSAGNSLTLGANATDINMSAATANLTLHNALVLGDANVWNVATGRLLTISGEISGAFPITKSGGGTAVLSGINLHTGSTTLAADSGTLEIGGAGKLGNGTYAGALEIGSGSTFKYNSSAAQTLNGPISGAGTLMKNAGSTLTLGGTNSSFTGTLTINAGTLNLGNADALGAASSISIAGGAALAAQANGVSTAVPVTLGAATTTSTFSFSRNTAAQGTLTLYGPISGEANLTFTTPNVNSGGNMQTIFLGSANSYAGNTTITTGNINNSTTIKALTADSLPTSTVLTLNGGNGAGTGRSVSFDLNSFDQTLAGLTNTLNLSSRSQHILNSGGDSVFLTINNSSNHTFSGNLNGTGLGLFKSGGGTQTLSASNLFTGSTTVGEGILSLGHSLAMQNSTLDTLDGIAGDPSNGLRTTVTTLTLGGISGDKNLASVFTTTSGGYPGLTALTLNPGAGATSIYSGIIANGADGMALAKTGQGTQILSGPNTYTGATSITAGTLAIGANNVLPETAVLIADATLDAATFSDTVGSLDPTGPATIHVGVGGKLAFADSSAIDWTGGTLTLSGTFVSGSSLRFGTTSSGLTPAQLALVTAEGFLSLTLDANGYLTTVTAAGFSSWITGTFAGGASVPADQQGPHDDPDNDGISNLVEYALAGHDPTTPNPTVGTLNSNSLSFTKRSGTSGLTYAIQSSSDLGATDAWMELPAGPTYINDAATISHTLTPGTPVKFFLRLQISSN